MILSTLRIAIPQRRRGEILKTLKSMTGENRIQSGCLSSRLYHDENEQDVFMLEQVWRNQDYLDLYLRSEHYRRMLLVMEMAGDPPEIKFHTISEPAGLEVVEKAIGRKRNEDV